MSLATPAELDAHTVAGDDAATAAAITAARRSDPTNYGTIPGRTVSNLLAAEGRRAQLDAWLAAHAGTPAKYPLTSPALEVKDARSVPGSSFAFGPGGIHAGAAAAIQADGGLPDGTTAALAAACYAGEDVDAAGVARGRRQIEADRRERQIQRLRDAKNAALRGDPIPADAAAAFDAIELPGEAN